KSESKEEEKAKEIVKSWNKYIEAIEAYWKEGLIVEGTNGKQAEIIWKKALLDAESLEEKINSMLKTHTKTKNIQSLLSDITLKTVLWKKRICINLAILYVSHFMDSKSALNCINKILIFDPDDTVAIRLKILVAEMNVNRQIAISQQQQSGSGSGGN
ncbi:MAG: hypothetical protein HY606_00220, partial [Planctomycetes bacterium]|nr:hypothetical protein [Planctomycetota bacterium]